MLIEALAVVGGLGAVTGWIFAFRARGQAVDAKDHAMVCEADRAAALLKVATAERLQELSANSAAAARTEAENYEQVIRGLRSVIETERKAKGDLLARLQAKGIPVGDVALDAVVDGLFPNANRGDPGAGKDRGSQDPGNPGSVPDKPSGAGGTPGQKP